MRVAGPGFGLALIVAWMCGCAASSGARVGLVDRWRSSATVAGRPMPVESGGPGQVYFAELEAPEPAPLRSGVIAGTVVDEDGRPVASAEIRPADGSSRLGRDLSTTSDESGRYFLSGVRSGEEYTLIAESRDGLLVGRGTSVAPATSLLLRLADAASDTHGVDGNRVLSKERDQNADPPRTSRKQRSERSEVPGPRVDGNEHRSGSETEAELAGKSVARTAWHRNTTEGSVKLVASPTPAKRGEVPSRSSEVNNADSPVEDDGPNPLPPAKERPINAPGSESEPSGRGTGRDGGDSFEERDRSDETRSSVDGSRDESGADWPAQPEAEAPAPLAMSAARAEAAPRKRASWAEVSQGGEASTHLSTLPASTRRTGARSSADRGRDGRTLETNSTALPYRANAPEGVPPVSPASCQFDAKRQRLVDFQLTSIEGSPLRLKDLDADFILIDFWGTWCGPCRESVPVLAQLQTRYGDRTLRVVGVACEQGSSVVEKIRSVEAAASKLGINYPIVLSEADGRPCPLQQALHVQAYPTLVLLDREGHILWRGTGAGAETLNRLERVLAARANAAVLRR